MDGLDLGPIRDDGLVPDTAIADPGGPPPDAGDIKGDLAASGWLVLEPEAIDFGPVPEGVTASRPLVIRNDGNDQLRLHSVSLVDNPDQEFALATSLPMEIALAPSQSLEVRVLATNLLGGTGTFGATLRLTTDDPTRPVAEVPLTATRSGKPQCHIQATPWTEQGVLDLGAVPAGARRETTITLTNTGDAPISFRGVDLLACSGEEPFTCRVPFGDPGWIHGFFEEDLRPRVDPGDQVTVRLILDGLDRPPGQDLRARLQVLWSCASEAAIEVWPEDCSGEEACPPNLAARVEETALVATPAEVRFGSLALGCMLRQTLQLTATGSGPVEISGIVVDPTCNLEGAFTLPSLPPLPARLFPDETLELQIGFSPSSEFPYRCHLSVLDSSGQGEWIRVPLSGSGTAPETQVDTFQQGTSDPDILLVVDSSPSMWDDLEDLKKAFTPWLQTYATDGRMARLGLIGVAIAPTCPRVGNLQGPPRLLTAGDGDAFAALLDAMRNDLECDATTGEGGLEAARRAVSSPLVDDLGIACGNDLSCVPPYRCVDGFCGGANRGFLRLLSPLEVVLISDEDDQSPESVETYVRALQALKGFGGEGRCRFDVVAGEPPTGCSASGREAMASPRYLEAATNTGGNLRSFCAPSLTKSLQDFAQAPFPLIRKFPLSRAPNPATVRVWVNGEPCDQDWMLRTGPWHLEFVEEGACMPPAGARIEVRYQPACP